MMKALNFSGFFLIVSWFVVNSCDNTAKHFEGVWQNSDGGTLEIRRINTNEYDVSSYDMKTLLGTTYRVGDRIGQATFKNGSLEIMNGLIKIVPDENGGLFYNGKTYVKKGQVNISDPGRPITGNESSTSKPVEGNKYAATGIVITNEALGRRIYDFKIKTANGVIISLPADYWILSEIPTYKNGSKTSTDIRSLEIGTSVGIIGELRGNRVDASEIHILSAPSGQTEEMHSQGWIDFWSNFTNAISKKDRNSLISLSLAGNSFSDGGGGNSAEQLINSANDDIWKYWAASVAKGVKTFETTKKITKDDYMIFELRNGRWLWTGVMGD